MSDRNDQGSRPQEPGDAMRRDAEAARQEARRAGEELKQAARDARAAAGEAASTVAAEASAAARTLRAEGEAVLEGAKARAEDAAREGVRAGARQVGGVARAIHRAADELEGDSPELAHTIHDAAGRVDRMARALRERSPGDLLRGAEDFARRQPLVFFGAATLAGFALARFARSSAAHAHPRHGSVEPGPSRGDMARPEMMGAQRIPRPATPMPPASHAPGWQPGDPVSPQGHGPLVAADPGESVTYSPPSQGGV